MNGQWSDAHAPPANPALFADAGTVPYSGQEEERDDCTQRIRREQSSALKDVPVGRRDGEDGTEYGAGTETAEAVDQPQAVRPKEGAGLLRRPTGHLEKGQAAAGQLQNAEGDQDYTGLKDECVPVVEHEGGGEGCPHAERHEDRREPEIEDRGLGRQFALALKRVGKKGRQQESAAG